MPGISDSNRNEWCLLFFFLFKGESDIESDFFFLRGIGIGLFFIFSLFFYGRRSRTFIIIIFLLFFLQTKESDFFFAIFFDRRSKHPLFFLSSREVYSNKSWNSGEYSGKQQNRKKERHNTNTLLESNTCSGVSSNALPPMLNATFGK